MIAWLKRKFSKTNIEKARITLISATQNASRAISLMLKDDDLNYLPDHAESIARQAGVIVASLEVVKPGFKVGPERFQMAKAAFLATAGATLATWKLMEPYIEGAVALMNKRAKGDTGEAGEAEPNEAAEEDKGV